MTTPVPNRKRLIELATWVAGEDAKRRLGLPSEWAQATWVQKRSCGTICCIAGKVALDDGGRPHNWDGAHNGFETSRVIMPDGEDTTVGRYATRTLGLDSEQRWQLFIGARDLDGVLRTIAKILNAEPVR